MGTLFCSASKLYLTANPLRRHFSLSVVVKLVVCGVLLMHYPTSVTASQTCVSYASEVKRLAWPSATILEFGS